MNMLRRLPLASLVVAVVLGSAVAAHAQYTPVALGAVPDSTFNLAVAVNDRGDAVGTSSATVETSAALWTSEGLTIIGALPSTPPNSIAFDINRRGDVVGHSSVQTPTAYVNHAFLFTDGALVDLGTLRGHDFSYANGINDRGEIAGLSADGGTAAHLVLWRDGGISDLGRVPLGTSVTGINNRRQIIGYVVNDVGVRAFVWQNGAFIDLPPLAPGGDTFAQAINHHGDIVGAARRFPGDALHAVLWRDGAIVDLGVLPGGVSSMARGLNDKAQVVGWSEDATGARHGFLWEAGEMLELPPLPGGHHAGPEAINDHGVVVGGSTTADSFIVRATMWIPLKGRR
jgi:probable HAF family extracellular repeat protein